MCVTHLNLLVRGGVAIFMTFMEFADVMIYASIIKTVVLTMKRSAWKMTQKLD